MDSEFEVSGFKSRKKRGFVPKADKGKHHNYPAFRDPPTYQPFWQSGPTKDGKGYQLPLDCCEK